MRVLCYNWVESSDPKRRGGGVRIYQRNLVAALRQVPGIEVHELSSGLSYDLFAPRKPRWRKVTRGQTHPRYEIINSGVLAPAHGAFGSQNQSDHIATQDCFRDFLRREGPFDVVHFNNLEGLPASVLSLKRDWPQTKVILSLHNYYLFCPQVNFWHQEARTCRDFENGHRCQTCLPSIPEPSALRLGYALWPVVKWISPKHQEQLLHSFGQVLGRLKPVRTARPAVTAAAAFARRRKYMVELINTHCDSVLCVSDAVRKLAIKHGIKPALAKTSYIGTPDAEKFAITKPQRSWVGDDGILTMAYLGYMRRDKGFYFLLQALAAMPVSVARRIHLVVAAPTGADDAMCDLAALKPHLAKITHINGYMRSELDDVLKGVNIGVIPVLWHDNLPQVALEMHARHIPLLTSDLGGAKELSGCEDMIFRAGDIAHFTEKVTGIVAGNYSADAYWANAKTPTTMDDHVKDLMQFYAPDRQAMGQAAPLQKHSSAKARKDQDDKTGLRLSRPGTNRPGILRPG